MKESAEILIVEDEWIVAEDIKRSLQHHGYTVSNIIPSGEEALEMVEEKRPDLILMDIMLKGDMDGIEAASQIHSRFDIPVVYLTAYADEKVLHRAKYTEPFGFILKPFEERELNSSIEITLFKHRMEKKLKESEVRYRTLFETMAQGVIYQNSSGKIMSANPAAERILGLTLDQMKGRKSSDLNWKAIHEDGSHFPGDSHPSMVSLREGRQMKDVIMGVFNPCEKDYRWICISTVPEVKKGEDKPFQVYMTFSDITERKKMEDDLKRSQEQSHNFAQHIQQVREQERAAVARDIHDELGQLLTVLHFDISFIKKRLSHNQSTLIEKIGETREHIDAAIGALQRISHELRPTVLDDLSLIETMEGQIEEFKKCTDIKFKSEIENIVLQKDVSITVFRLNQEALTNAVRHAEASQINISLNSNGEKLILEVRDNGKGISEKNISDPKAFGLIGMKERLSSLNGEMKIKGIKGKGTTVSICIPLKEQLKDEGQKL